MRPSNPLLAALAVALAPVFAPALAADGTDDASDDHAQLKADIAKLEGKIDTLTKTVVSSVGRVTDNVSSLTTKVENSTARGEVAVFFGKAGSSELYAAGGNIAEASVSAIPGGSGIKLPAGTYEITALDSAGHVGWLEMHDGRNFRPLSQATVSSRYRGSSVTSRRGVVSAAVSTVYSFHRQRERAIVTRVGTRPATVASYIKEVTVRRL